MKQRIITGTVFGAVVLVVLFLSHTVVYPIAISLLCLIGTFEMLRCVGSLRIAGIVVPSFLYVVASMVAALEFRYGVLLTLTVAYLFVLLIVMVVAHEKIKSENVCTTFAMIVYITMSFVCLLRLRYVSADIGSDEGVIIGQYFYLLVFLAAWGTDTFAYFTGVFFGKHKLCPKISPKKTVEGSLGGIVFTVIGFLLYGLVMKTYFALIPNYVGLAVVAVLMSVLAQLGDLLASVIKRTYGIKDYGNLFPGHGGVLDRFDSVLLLAPFLLMLVEDAHFARFLFRF